MSVSKDDLVQAFVASDVGWWIGTDQDARIQQLHGEVKDIEAEYRHRFPVESRSLRGRLIEQMVDQQDSLKPLIQTFASPMTNSIRAMVLAVLRGANVLNFSASYVYRQQSHLVVRVGFPTGEESEFTTDDLWDFEVLRHFGLMKISGLPAVDGYYAFRKQAPT